MLLSLSIENFAIVRQVNVEFAHGLSVITGETGAGKSIAIDGLSLCLGARADASAVRKGADKAQLIATFGIGKLPKVKAWLDEHELGHSDHPEECHIRRVISADGRSKAFINGISVTLSQLKQLASQLLAIHGQHAHHHLLKPEAQLTLLDSYANHPELLANVAQAYQLYHETQQTLNALTKAQQQRLDRRHLLAYQVDELDNFALQADEFNELEIEYKRLSNAKDLIENAQKAAYRISDDEQHNAVKMVSLCIRELSEQVENDPALADIVTCLTEAEINLQEAANELQDYCSQLANELARKHAVIPEVLHQYHAELKAEYESLQGDDEQLQSLQNTLAEYRNAYVKHSKALSVSRQQAGKKFAAEIVQSVSKMNMPHTQMLFAVEHSQEHGLSALGQDEVNILITTNPGQPLGRLDEVVSGGELSRIGLAIQVITSDQNAIPTLIFDEVDTGISGPTASIIGQLLRTLGQQTQVLCVTHLPQVAAQGHQQLFVNKLTDGKSTETSMRKLDESSRVRELARLLAGDEITDTAIANAEELLKKVS
jgi:DNA repair protein RecN (Recombination protein N)